MLIPVYANALHPTTMRSTLMHTPSLLRTPTHIVGLCGLTWIHTIHVQPAAMYASRLQISSEVALLSECALCPHACSYRSVDVPLVARILSYGVENLCLQAPVACCNPCLASLGLRNAEPIIAILIFRQRGLAEPRCPPSPSWTAAPSDSPPVAGRACDAAGLLKSPWCSPCLQSLLAEDCPPSFVACGLKFLSRFSSSASLRRSFFSSTPLRSRRYSLASLVVMRSSGMVIRRSMFCSSSSSAFLICAAAMVRVASAWA